MSFELEFDDDLSQRRLQRLEQRLRRAQNVLAGARALYGSLRESRGAGECQLHQALLQVERAQRTVTDILFDIQLAEAQATPVKRATVDRWDGFGH